ncbi:hypothetical protein OG948_02140 [Embleya sp. NBC_00888]|nr:hypothetical protein OG948_02140 [Embleya sp. NBC_00888]
MHPTRRSALCGARVAVPFHARRHIDLLRVCSAGCRRSTHPAV